MSLNDDQKLPAKVTHLLLRLRSAGRQRTRGGKAWADYCDAADMIENLAIENAGLKRAASEGKREDSCGCCSVVVSNAPVLCEDCIGSFTKYADGSAFCDKHPDPELTGESSDED